VFTLAVLIVTPLAGVWIEIDRDRRIYSGGQSLPSRECGLKWCSDGRRFSDDAVTPLAGVWIEIGSRERRKRGRAVTPLAGVWIEIGPVVDSPGSGRRSLPSRECGLKCAGAGPDHPGNLSLPSRECGLKWGDVKHLLTDIGVTPLAGVWIEIRFANRCKEIL